LGFELINPSSVAPHDHAGQGAVHNAAAASRKSTVAILAQEHKLMLNFRRKSLAAPASIDQEFVQIFTQTSVIIPQSREGIRNSRKALQQTGYVNSRGKASCPLGGRGQLLVQRLP
jgi:hypothetical protein